MTQQSISREPIFGTGASIDVESAGETDGDAEGRDRDADRRDRDADATATNGADAATTDDRPTGDDARDGSTRESTTDRDDRTVTVTLDNVLLALVDLAVDSDANGVDSREACVTLALEETLGPVVAGDRETVDRPITTERYVAGRLDPVLDELLRLTVQTSSEFDRLDEFVRHLLLDAVDVDPGTTEVVVPEYDRYEFVIEHLRCDEDCPHDTVDEVVHASIECLFGVHPNRDNYFSGDGE